MNVSEFKNLGITLFVGFFLVFGIPHLTLAGPKPCTLEPDANPDNDCVDAWVQVQSSTTFRFGEGGEVNVSNYYWDFSYWNGDPFYHSVSGIFGNDSDNMEFHEPTVNNIPVPSSGWWYYLGQLDYQLSGSSDWDSESYKGFYTTP